MLYIPLSNSASTTSPISIHSHFSPAFQSHSFDLSYHLMYITICQHYKALLPPPITSLPHPLSPKQWKNFWYLYIPLPSRAIWFHLLHKKIPCQETLKNSFLVTMHHLIAPFVLNPILQLPILSLISFVHVRQITLCGFSFLPPMSILLYSMSFTFSFQLDLIHPAQTFVILRYLSSHFPLNKCMDTLFKAFGKSTGLQSFKILLSLQPLSPVRSLTTSLIYMNSFNDLMTPIDLLIYFP